MAQTMAEHLIKQGNAQGFQQGNIQGIERVLTESTLDEINS